MAGQDKNIDNTPQAKDDVAAATENVSLTLDVMANDLGGKAKSLYSLNQADPGKPATSGVTAAGARVSLEGGKVVYLADSARANALGAGQTLTDTFTYTIQMGNGALSVATVTVTLTGTNDGPVAVADLASGGENQRLLIDALANDTDVDAGATKTLVSVSAPKGAASIVDGKIAFDPGAAFDGLAAGQTETVTLTYVMKDDKGATATSSVVVTVTGTNDAPVAVADTAAGGENQTLVIDALANDTDVDAGATKTLVSVSAPKGSASIVDGKIAFEPGAAFDGLAAGQTETVTLTYVMMDDKGATATSRVVVTVTGTNDAPVAVADTAAGGENQTLVIDALANDTDVDAGATRTLVSVSAAKGSASIVDGKIAFEPGAAFDGLAPGQTETVTLTYVMKDENGATATSSVVVTVTGTNDAPVAVADTATTGENQALVIDALANDTDVDAGATRTLVSVSAPKGAASIVDGKIAFDPGAAFDGLAEGQTEQLSLTYLMRDEHGATSTANVLVTVTGTNDAPLAAADSLQAFEDAAILITAADLTGNDADVDSPASALRIASVTSGVGGTAVLNADGTVTFTPATNFNGPASFTYTLTDGSRESAPPTVSVDVRAVNDAPTAVADTGATGENQVVVLDVLANDTDVDGTARTLVSAQAPKGSVSIVDGKLVFDPGTAFERLAAGQSEDVTLTYTIADEGGLTALGAAVVTITAANDAPLAAPDAAATGENQAVSVDVLVNDVDADAGAVKTLVSVTTPKGAAAVADGKVLFTPGAAFDGLSAGQTEDVTLTYVMRDDQGATSTSTLVVRVTGANDAPVIVQPMAAMSANSITERPDRSADENTYVHTLGGTVAFKDPDLADLHTATVTPAGAGYIGQLTLGAVDQAGDRVGWTFKASDSALDGLAAGETRTQTYSITVSDGRGGTATQTVSVTLKGSADVIGAPVPQQPDALAFIGSTYRVLSGVTDSNGDGVLDTARVTAARTILSGFAARGGDVGDLDGDGDLDAVVSNWSGRSAVLTNRGDTNADGQPDFGVSYLALASDGVNQWQDVVLADVNGDGRLDIVEGGRTADRLHLNLGDVNGDGTTDFAMRLLTSPSTSYSYGVDVADLNGDGRKDILLTTYGAAAGQTTLAVLLNLGDANGDGTPEFRASTLSTVDTTLAGVDVADMNGDGVMDIAVAAHTGGSYVLQGRGDINGDGTPDFYNSGTLASSGYMETGFVDIDGDGDLDVLFADRGGGSTLAINLGDTNGDGVANFRVVGLTHGGDGLTVSDFDRDGDADLLFSDGWVATNRGDLNGDGAPDFAYAQLVSLTGAWDVAAGDFLI
ncbi:Ig-like domain-containing protein [Phenylobacterium sp.]|jgi:VCBS repeat-containing protein|uniref:Ig-like domain-containing protein n=1 Tax=Phenylobacterium sp. TaxID=1871053 RepID=UPI002F93AE1E